MNILKERALEVAPSAKASEFDVFASRYLDSGYRLASLILRDDIEAEDATHDAFVRAWQRWSTLADPAKAEAWFMRILTNVCRDRLRQRRRRPVVDISAALAVRGGSDPSGTLARREGIERAFERLSPDHRVAVVLRYYQDLTVEQIAERCGVPAGTVKSRLHHALRELGGAMAADSTEELR